MWLNCTFYHAAQQDAAVQYAVDLCPVQLSWYHKVIKRSSLSANDIHIIGNKHLIISLI